MKTLFLMRHAKSSWKDNSLSDHDRPLNSRGRYDAPRIGEILAETGRLPEIIFCSTAVRARETVEKAFKSLMYKEEIKYLRDLYHADTETFLTLITNLKGNINSAMVVGHNPGMEMAVEDFTGEWIRMPTGAVAEIVFDISNWEDLRKSQFGKLVEVLRPRQI